MRYSGISLAFILALAGPVSPASAQQQDEQPPQATGNGTATASLDPNALPVSVKRIQRALSRPPAIRTESTRPVFRVEVFSRKPTIDDILGPDWRKGPTPLGAMSHQEFLNLVTPKDVQGYAAFDNKQAITVAATSFALQWALKQAVQKYHDAKTERAKEAAKKEVDDALAALRKARREAGLPDK
jgi:hypothetical protein